MPLFGLAQAIAKVCDWKARQPVDGTNGSELKLQFACNFAFSLRTLRTVKDGSEPLAIHTFPLHPLQNWCMFV